MSEPHQESSRKVTKRWAPVPRAEGRSMLIRVSSDERRLRQWRHADHFVMRRLGLPRGLLKRRGGFREIMPGSAPRGHREQ
jgi:hypothetical protein